MQFKTRGFVSLVSTFSFLISLVSGIVLYFPPQGRIAHWVNWTFWGLEKETWGALHINSSLVFFLVIFVHIYYNWKILIGYLKKKAQSALNLKLELLITVFLSFYIVVASTQGWQPFKQIIDWNESIKDAYAARAEYAPPIAHAEQLSVDDFCEKLDIPMAKFENKMKSNNWTFEKDQTIADMARANNTAPVDIYKALQASSTHSSNSNAVGWGRMTLQEVCAKYQIDMEQAIEKLAEKGIDAQPALEIRALAGQAGLRPYKVIELLQGATIDHQ